MAQRVFFLNRLREGVDPAVYERWVREVDYPFARALPAIRSYVVTRLDGLLEGGAAPYHYLEVVEITDLDAYRESLGEAKDFAEQWSRFVGESVAVYGEVLK